jgi:hypothetical protein
MLVSVPENVAGHYRHLDAQPEQMLEVAQCASLFLASSERLDISSLGGKHRILGYDLADVSGWICALHIVCWAKHQAKLERKM